MLATGWPLAAPKNGGSEMPGQTSGGHQLSPSGSSSLSIKHVPSLWSFQGPEKDRVWKAGTRAFPPKLDAPEHSDGRNNKPQVFLNIDKPPAFRVASPTRIRTGLPHLPNKFQTTAYIPAKKARDEWIAPSMPICRSRALLGLKARHPYGSIRAEAAPPGLRIHRHVIQVHRYLHRRRGQILGAFASFGIVV